MTLMIAMFEITETRIEFIAAAVSLLINDSSLPMNLMLEEPLFS
jgi:hypothetical protein